MVCTIMFHTNFLNPLSIKNSYSDSHIAVFTLMFICLGLFQLWLKFN